MGIGLVGAAVILAILLIVVLRVASPSRFPPDAIFVPRDVATLEEAFKRASSGMTVVLQAQEEAFKGPVIIDVANITLASRGGRATLEAEGSEPALTIRADGVTVKNLGILAAGIGLQVESSRCRVEDVLVRDAPIGMQLVRARGCELEDLEVRGAKIGLNLVSSDGNHLDGLVISEAAESGVKVVKSSNNSFEDIVITTTPIGVSLEQGSTGNEFRSCRIEQSSIVGIEIRGSNDTTLRDSVVRDSGIGVALEGVTGSEVSNCRIKRSSVAAVSLRQAVKNRVLENTIDAAADAGIELSQSPENTLSYNHILHSFGAGIRLDRSDRNLIMENVLSGNGIAIRADRSSYSRVLRNSLSANELAGLFFNGGEKNRFLDNQVIGGTFGIALAESGKNILLRNRVEDQKVSGLSLVNGSHENNAATNRISGSGVGILIAVSARGELFNNHLSGNDIGLVLFRPGSGVRIEGNAIGGNEIGLRQDDVATDIKAALDLLGIDLGEGHAEPAPPVIANNVFARNHLMDILNESALPLYAAGNWWGGLKAGRTEVAVVSEGVYLEESAWKGTIAVGTEEGISQVLLGRVLQLALTDTGFRVVDLVGMGDRLRVQEALRMRDVDLICGTTDSIHSEVLGETSDIEIISIPAKKGWVAVVSGTLAKRLPELTISALLMLASETGETFRYTAPQAFSKGAFASFVEAYGLQKTVSSISWTKTLEEAETLLKFGAADLAIVGNLEEALTFSGFVTLKDDLSAFESTDVAVILRQDLLSQFLDIEDVFTNLTSRLTTAAIHDLTSRVRLLHREPEDVAREFLLHEGLLAD